MNIFLKKLQIHNFKGVKSLEVDFDKHSTDISGDNGVGKTTVFDAFTWVLFGKDSHDRKDFNIKTLDSDGRAKQKLEHSVQATLLVNGEETTLRRTYKEQWVKKKGALEAELSGNTTDFYINEVPKKAGEYAKAISEILDENIFKLVTNPKAFTSLPWKSQREILFSISGTISDTEIAAGNPKFSELLARLGGKKMDDYKAQILSQKKKLKEDLAAIPTRIDEAERGKPSEIVDFDAIEKEIVALQKNVEKIDAAIEDKSNAYQEAFEKKRGILAEINAKKTEQQDLIFQAQQEIGKKDFEIKNEKAELIRQKFDAEGDKRRWTLYCETLTNDIAANTEQRDALREEWKSVDAETYSAENDGKLLCPVWKIVCGDPESNRLHQENQDKARQTFNAEKVRRIESIDERGQALNSKIQNLEADLLEKGNLVKEAQEKIAELEKKIALYPSDQAKPKEVNPQSIPSWVKLQSEITELEATIQEPETVDTTDLKEERATINAHIRDLNQQLGQREGIARADKRIEELEAEGKNLAQKISDLEKDEFTIDAFTKAKIEESEARINGRFQYVQFRLFEAQVNGGESETCEAMIGGVPFADANTASQINAGIDIIRVLSKFYDATAPVFIDHAESVNELLDLDSQMVRLVVSRDKKLKIT